MTADELRQEIEMSVVAIIKDRLEQGTITEERSQQISQVVLDKLAPGMSLEAILKVIPKLDDTCPELAPTILPILRHYEDTVARQGERNVTELIAQGQYDAAAKLAEKVINQDVGTMWIGSAKPNK